MKIKNKTKKRIQGSISVLLVIILLPMMTFSAIIVDISRINMAKQMMSSAGDLTMNTALANYDTILKDVYGLFAMSQAEDMNNEQLGTELNKYFAKTLSSYGVVSQEDADDYVATLIGDFRNILNNGSIDTNNFLQLNNINLTATKVEGSSLANASVMRKQIVEYMKYRAPLGLGLSFLDSLTSFKKMDAQNKVVEAQVKAQESTQDVTKACQTLIKLIRDYDKRVEEINKALAGASYSADSAIIPLEDYDSHVLKYLSSWGTEEMPENYTHINKLTLVFLANTPSVNDVYLKSLAYAGGERYIKTDGTLYSGGNSTGINVTVDLAGDTAGAKTQIDQQITNMNNNCLGYIDKYDASMLKSELLTYNTNNINAAMISKENEDAAISSFIKFEKFLLDQSDDGGITYSQVKSVLEQIATLDKYRANYENKINADISSAEAEQQAAQSALNSLVSSRDGAAETMNDRITYINNRISSFVNEYDDLDDALNFLGTDNKQSEIKAALAQLPARSVGYSQYYNSNIKSGDSDKFIEYFKWLLNSSSFGTDGTDAQRKIITEAKNHVNANGWDANGFDNYMKGKLSDSEEGEDLFKLLSCLKTCHAYAITYKSNASTYDNAVNQIPGAQSTLNEKTQKVASLNNTKTNTLNSVKTCLQGYYSFGMAYQADAYYYNYYINAAKNTVGPEAQKIQTHFTKLLGYIAELRTDLNEIDVQIGKVKSAIATYNSNLTNWNTANTTYESNNGGDSFSSQTADDIEKAKTEYDAALYDTLDTFVIAMWNEFDDLYSKLTENTNFTYGAKRIDQIASADDLISAISETNFSDVVTVEEATQKLSTLYKGETIEYNPYTMDYSNPKQLCFLSPVILQIQALKYLNSAYPDDSKLTEEQKTANATQKNNYNMAKDKLTGKDTSGSSGSDGTTDSGASSGSGDKVTNDFGYTFDTQTILNSLPSSLTSTDKKEFSDTEYTLTETGEGDDAKLNASSSVSGQTSTSSSVLSGIGDIATTAVENLYILNYVFENFSYNTTVQEQVIKDNPLNSDSVFGQMTEAGNLFADADKVSAAKKNVTTLSNYNINEYNNYLYGGEVEYILFGNSTPSKNVTSAKASIYAIRFCFNCIYAFTDSEIRNSTMAAGLAVQAATLGIVPYQVVQIVLQLALAAAESAIDLSAMNDGLSIAIIKTKDTWALSMAGAKNALKDAANAALNIATDAAAGAVDSAIKNVTNGLNDLVDAGADELKGAIGDLSDNMTSAAEGVLESVVDSALTAVMSEIEAGLNSLQYVNSGGTILPSKADVRAEAVSLFQNVRGKIDTIISDACGGNEMALSIAETLRAKINGIINSMETKVLGMIDSAGEVDITSYITQEINNLKIEMIKLGNSAISDLRLTIQTKAESIVSESSETLKGYISQCGEDLSEEAANKIKEELSTFADNFVENTLKVNGTNSTAADSKGSVVSMFKFGYKDYLMLLTYISICCGDSVLVRTSDVIQMNIQTAGEGADYQHKANTEDGSFLMSKAYTYISISATTDLDMFFMDLGIFADQVADDATDLENGEDKEETDGTQITYKGLLGY